MNMGSLWWTLFWETIHLLELVVLLKSNKLQIDWIKKAKTETKRLGLRLFTGKVPSGGAVQIWKRSLICSVRPTVTPDESFSKTYADYSWKFINVS